MAVLARCGGTPLRVKKFPGWTQAGEADRRLLERTYASGDWSPDGENNRRFCEKFAAFSGVKHCFTVANGTVSIQLILRALGIGYGDEVIVPPYTFIASVSSLIYSGVTPVFVDIDPQTFQLSPEAAERAITPRTKAIMPVYVGGCPADLDSLREICDRHGLFLIGDQAQAVGAEYRSKGVAAFADASSISCQNSKNLTCGEGGIILSDDDGFAERLRAILHGGIGADGVRSVCGAQYGMSEFQASLLLSQLEALPAQIERRAQNGRYLDERLSQLGFVYTLNNGPKVTTNAYHLYMFGFRGELPEGVGLEAFAKAVRVEGAPVNSGYMPLYTFPCLDDAYTRKCIGGRIDLHPDTPVTERVSHREGLWIYQTALLAGKEDMDDIVNALVKVYENRAELKSYLERGAVK